jgi:hypothetical protein
MDNRASTLEGNSLQEIAASLELCPSPPSKSVCTRRDYVVLSQLMYKGHALYDGYAVCLSLFPLSRRERAG